jgi:tetratricopeptide (TPR) repeat protein
MLKIEEKVQSQNFIRLTLYEGVSLLNMLLRLGHFNEAIFLARQMLVQYPQVLPLHVGIGRALLANNASGEHLGQAIGHLRRVLSADPENWRLRLEVMLLYLRSKPDNFEQASQELWLALQAAPANRRLRQVIDSLPEQPLFQAVREWNRNTQAALSSLSDGAIAADFVDEGGLARLYMYRRLAWMALQQIEATYRHLTKIKQAQPSTLFRITWLQALWQNGNRIDATNLASEMLSEQPQLILPRLLLASQLSRSSLLNNPDTVTNLLEPVWEIDPFMYRTMELVKLNNIPFAAGILPSLAAVANNYPLSGKLAGWRETYFQKRLGLRLGELDPVWLETLLMIERQPAERSFGIPEKYNPHSEVSYTLTELDGSPPELPQPQTEAVSPVSTDLQGAISGIAEVENMLYGRNRYWSGTDIKPKAGVQTLAKGLGKKRKNGNGAKIEINLNSNAIAPSESLRQTVVLVITGEQALTRKFGREGWRQIEALLKEMVESKRLHGMDARLLVVDNAESLRRSGFRQLNPISTAKPEAIRDLINAALPDVTHPSHYPDSIFIIGGHEVIPFWEVANPSFDTDKTVYSDNPYGARDHTYLLPERMVGRLPDGNSLEFLLARLRENVSRQKTRLSAHSPFSALPLKIIENLIPPGTRTLLSGLDDGLPFEEAWLHTTLADNRQFLDKERSAQLSPFFYSAEVWRKSTETLKSCVSGSANLVYSPPLQGDSFERNLLNRPQLLHFNLHGFRDNANWYGQRHTTRIVPPKLSSLPVAFTPGLAAQVQNSGTVVFSEACYGSYLNGKNWQDSIALTFLARGAAAFVGSTVISYGSFGPELSCASHLSYYFWKEVLLNGSSFGRALQAAKTSYVKERLAAGHNLSGDDAKTLLEFVLLGDPTLSMRAVTPNVYTGASPRFLVGTAQNQQKGILEDIEDVWQDIERLSRKIPRFWGKFSQFRERYRPISYNKLPRDLSHKIEKFLAWLLPDPMPLEPLNIQTLLDLGDSLDDEVYSYRLSQRFAKGSNISEEVEGEALSEDSHLLLTGQIPLLTDDGRTYEQTLHLTTNLKGDQMKLNLSK